MNDYKNFAYYFDIIMDFIDYNKWINFTKNNIKKDSSILDLACGSATFLVNMNIYGYPTDGLDLSSQMIQLAHEKCYINHIQCSLFKENMIDFNLSKQYDNITCYFDSVNHLNTIDDVHKLFDMVYKHLKKDGLFLFDIFSYSRFIDANNTNIEEEIDNFKYQWKMNVEKPNTIHHKIKINEENEEFNENYDEHYYDYKDLLKDKRFKLVKVVGDFKNKLDENDERILIILKKI